MATAETIRAEIALIEKSLEQANLKLAAIENEPYQVRVMAEKSELDVKITALTMFIGTERYFRAPEPEQVNLRLQVETMMEYSTILGKRIQGFE